MLGKIAGTKPTDRADHNQMLLIFGSVVAVLIIGLPFVYVLEQTLKRIDRVNQEQISWTCNGNGDTGMGISSCRPTSRA